MIRPNMSEIKDIRDAMYITKAKGLEYQVTKNWRNTKQTAEIAAHFYAGLETGIPELPDRAGPKPSVVGFDNLHNLAEIIVSLAQRKRGAAAGSGPSVGVIVFASDPRLKELDLTLRQVAEKESEVEDQIDIRRYDSKGFKDEPFVFDTPESVTIVTPFTMKGLEWDNVVVILDNLVLKDSPEQKTAQLMQCYVAASRPRNRLLIAWTGKMNSDGHVPPIVISGLFDQSFEEKIEKEWKNGK
jgi:superfamily I DNA/RNA helicase